MEPIRNTFREWEAGFRPDPASHVPPRVQRACFLARRLQEDAVARQTPAEGVGLFRTELCFLDRDVEPSVAEQADIYAEVLTAYAGRKVVVRRDLHS